MACYISASSPPTESFVSKVFKSDLLRIVSAHSGKFSSFNHGYQCLNFDLSILGNVARVTFTGAIFVPKSSLSSAKDGRRRLYTRFYLGIRISYLRRGADDDSTPFMPVFVSAFTVFTPIGSSSFPILRNNAFL